MSCGLRLGRLRPRRSVPRYPPSYWDRRRSRASAQCCHRSVEGCGDTDPRWYGQRGRLWTSPRPRSRSWDRTASLHRSPTEAAIFVAGFMLRPSPKRHSLPSTPRFNQRPPLHGSTTTSAISELPIERSFGQNSVIRAVDNSNVCAWPAAHSPPGRLRRRQRIQYPSVLLILLARAAVSVFLEADRLRLSASASAADRMAKLSDTVSQNLSR